MKIKTTMKYHYTPIRMAKTDTLTIGIWINRTLTHCWQKKNGKATLEMAYSVLQFLTKLNILLPHDLATKPLSIYPTS